jgi:hypothetical protein
VYDFCAIFQDIAAIRLAQDDQDLVEPLAVIIDISVLGISAPNA